MFETITSLLGGTTDEGVVLECRNCGTSVETRADRCPHCGPDSEIVEYDID